MARTDVAAAANVTIEPVATYHTDPRGVGAFRRLLTSITDAVNGRTGQHIYAPQPAFHGYAISPQRYTGAANLGTSRVVTPRSSTIGQEREANPTNAVAMQVFAERMRQGRG